MAKEIAFHISVENTALQQLLKDLGTLTTLYDKLTKSQDALKGSTAQLSATQEKILKVEKQILAEGNKLLAISQKQTKAAKELLATTIQNEQADKKAVGTINELNAEKKRLTEAINELNLKTEEGKNSFVEYANKLKDVSSEIAQYEASLSSASGNVNQFSVHFGASFDAVKTAVSQVGKSFGDVKKGIDALGIKELDQFSRGMGLVAEQGERAGKIYNAGKGIFQAYQKVTLAITAAQLAYKNGVTLATVVQKAFNVAVKSNPLGLIVTLLASAAAAFASYQLGSEESTESQQDFNAALTETQELLQEATKAETMVKILDKLDKRQVDAFKQNVEKQIEANKDLLAKQATYKQRQKDLYVELQSLTAKFQQTNDKEAAKSLYNYYKEYQKNAKLIKEINATEIEASLASLNTVLGKTTEHYNKLYNPAKTYETSVNGLNEKISDLIKAQNNLNLSTEKGVQKFKEYGDQIEQTRQELAKLQYEAENGKIDPLAPVTLKTVEPTQIDNPGGSSPDQLPG
nr:hypothetical protein [Cytophagales bacterium]